MICPLCNKSELLDCGDKEFQCRNPDCRAKWRLLN